MFESQIMYIRIYFSCILVIAPIVSIFSQTIRRETVAAQGSFYSSDGMLQRQTTGQAFGTSVNPSEAAPVIFRPGFQQPLISSHKKEAPGTLRVYPNPANDIFYIVSPDTMSQCRLLVADNLGRILISRELTSFIKYSVDCSGFAQGSYAVYLQSGKVRYTTKVIVHH